MILHSKRRSLPAEIVCNPEIMGGVPTVRGTRIPVEMILIQVRAGCSRKEIFRHYPGLPLDGIEATALRRVWRGPRRPWGRLGAN